MFEYKCMHLFSKTKCTSQIGIYDAKSDPLYDKKKLVF